MAIKTKRTNRENLELEIQAAQTTADALEVELRESSQTNSVRLQNVYDSATDERDLRAKILLHNFTVARIQTLTKSIQAIDAGTHGVCQDCECEIGERRMAVAPESTLCIACQEKHEGIVRLQKERFVPTPGLQNMYFVPLVA